MVKAMRRTKNFGKVTSEEIRLIKMWHSQDEKAPSEIASLLHRSESTITRHLFLKKSSPKQRRKPVLTDKQVDSLVVKTKQYIEQAAGTPFVHAVVRQQPLMSLVSERCPMPIPGTLMQYPWFLRAGIARAISHSLATH